jgi:hypothetical protein
MSHWRPERLSLPGAGVAAGSGPLGPPELSTLSSCVPKRLVAAALSTLLSFSRLSENEVFEDLAIATPIWL